jgi:hypothetical protein
VVVVAAACGGRNELVFDDDGFGGEGGDGVGGEGAGGLVGPTTTGVGGVGPTTTGVGGVGPTTTGIGGVGASTTVSTTGVTTGVSTAVTSVTVGTSAIASSSASVGSGPLDCLACIQGNCPEATACLQNPACLQGTLCTVSQCLGGSPDFGCILGCFNGDFLAAFQALQALGCVFSQCGQECQGAFGP